MNILVFDIETIPDTHSGRILHNLGDLPDKEVADAMFAAQEAQSGNTFLRHHLQKIAAISLVLRTENNFKVCSIGDETSTEKEIITRFFAGIDKYKPTLVSWNGSGFDLPVLHYRALLHGVASPSYWETGDNDSNARWNNYLNRYHYRHTDLMDVLAMYQSRAYAPLNDLAIMLGFPGKMGIEGSQVWDYFQRGELTTIRHYCETDVLNTYLIYLRFEVIRGHLSEADYNQECTKIIEILSSENQPHLQAFLKEWQGNRSILP